jgi:uncharacterized membrane protein
MHNTANRSSQTHILLICFAVFSVSLSVLRVIATDSLMFLFLNWNLILAILPWIITQAVQYNRIQLSRFKLSMLIFVWILFFPNSPYILTDLFHLHKGGDMPLWYDLVLILSFAFTGLLFGMLSLMRIEQYLQKYFSHRTVIMAIGFMLFLSGFGVYLGRYLRFNSWDLITAPYQLLSEVGDRFVSPSHHPRTWGMTLVLGLFLNLVYFTIRGLRYHRS